METTRRRRGNKKKNENDGNAKIFFQSIIWKEKRQAEEKDKDYRRYKICFNMKI